MMCECAVRDVGYRWELAPVQTGSWLGLYNVCLTVRDESALLVLHGYAHKSMHARSGAQSRTHMSPAENQAKAIGYLCIA